MLLGKENGENEGHTPRRGSRCSPLACARSRRLRSRLPASRQRFTSASPPLPRLKVARPLAHTLSSLRALSRFARSDCAPLPRRAWRQRPLVCASPWASRRFARAGCFASLRRWAAPSRSPKGTRTMAEKFFLTNRALCGIVLFGRWLNCRKAFQSTRKGRLLTVLFLLLWQAYVSKNALIVDMPN